MRRLHMGRGRDAAPEGMERMSDPFADLAGMPAEFKLRLIKASANIVGHTVGKNRERYVALYAERENLTLADADTAIDIFLGVLTVVHRDVKGQI